MNTEFNCCEWNMWSNTYQKKPFNELMTIKKQMEKDGTYETHKEQYTALTEIVAEKWEAIHG